MSDTGDRRDPTEDLRRVEQALINSGLVEVEGPTWTTDALTAEFEVLSFMAPYVLVRRRSDGVVGSLQFRHAPRVYFGWQADAP